jgi:hypothetical protein
MRFWKPLGDPTSTKKPPNNCQGAGSVLGCCDQSSALPLNLSQCVHVAWTAAACADDA